MALMGRKVSSVFFATLFCLLVGRGFADVGISAKAGTTGVGGEFSVRLSSNFNLRAGYTWLSVKAAFEDNSDDTDSYDIDLRLRTIPLLLDWHPWKTEFRISAGAVFNGNKLVVSAEEGSTIDVGDGEYTVASLEGKVSFKDFVPYAGIGYGNAADKRSRLHFAFDLGVMFQGKADVSLKAVAADPLLQPLLEWDVAREEEELEDDLSQFTLYPILSFGISFSF